MSPSSHELKWLEACRLLAPLFSTCSRRQYFAVVLSPNKRVAGIGYNGAPSGMAHCVDGGCPRGRSTVAPGSAYDDPQGFCVAQHAEAGALLWSDPMARRDGTLVVNGPPCLECARLVASSGVRRIVHLEDAAYEGWAGVAGFLAAAGVEVCGVPREDDGHVIDVVGGDGTVLARIDGALAEQVVALGAARVVSESLRGYLGRG